MDSKKLIRMSVKGRLKKTPKKKQKQTVWHDATGPQPDLKSAGQWLEISGNTTETPRELARKRGRTI